MVLITNEIISIIIWAKVGKCTWTVCTWLFLSFIWTCWHSDLFCRNGTCALCRRAEQICYAGSGLPHDSSEHDFSGGHQDSEGPPWRHAKPRFPTAAQRSGQHTARQPQCNIKPLVASEFQPFWPRPWPNVFVLQLMRAECLFQQSSCGQ